jgi:hypothetical protein
MCFLAAPYNQRRPSGRDESIVVHQEVREEAVVGDLGLLMVYGVVAAVDVGHGWLVD